MHYIWFNLKVYNSDQSGYFLHALRSTGPGSKHSDQQKMSEHTIDNLNAQTLYK